VTHKVSTFFSYIDLAVNSFPSTKMKLSFVTLLLATTSASAHLGHSHHKTGEDDARVVRLGSHTAKLPTKTNHSTIDWTQDDQPFRLGDHQFTSLKEFKDNGARCGSREPDESSRVASQEQVEAYLKAHPEVTANNSTRRLQAINIPVYLHCFRSGRSGGECAFTVTRQIAVLNAAYAPTFSFSLVSALMYDRPDYYNCDAENPALERRMKQEFRQGGMSTLNLYACNPAGGTLGWATFPDGSMGGGSRDVKMDGVVIGTGTMPGGNKAPYNLGDTAVHEVGHWLGLYHTFQGGCSGSGDLVSDTPAEASAAFSCDLGRNTCSSAGNDPVQNYMDYTEDNCLSRFTTKQRERMIAQWNLYRAGK
jgi:Pregnancy-associated plasma protein-A